MPFQSLDTLNKPRIGQAMCLGRGHIDPATLALTFHYQEKQESGGVWFAVDLEQVLTEGAHYSLNARDGQITLLPHGFWDSESTWRQGDREEPLLYKNVVKHPQRISVSFEYFAPESVKVHRRMDRLGAGNKALARRQSAQSAEVIDFGLIDTEAQQRLGYDVPAFVELAE